jgi:hypothetical protein
VSSLKTTLRGARELAIDAVASVVGVTVVIGLAVAIAVSAK